MKMKSISGLVFYVKDIAKTADFYETVGFQIVKKEADHLSIRLNWFWADFHPQDKSDIPEFQKESDLSNKGAGIYVYISVEDIDKFYEDLLAKGLKPSSKPQDYPWGNREFLLHDPDGYKLVFFEKK